MTDITKIQIFAKKVEDETIIQLGKSGVACQANIDNARTKIKPGNKFTKVDIGGSGRYMVENKTGNIFGIKGYGTVHRGHFYGTVDTINEYYWGAYYPEKISGQSLPSGRMSCPGLTFAPEPVLESQQVVSCDTVGKYLSQPVTARDLMA